MINLNNFLTKCSVALLLTCMQTSSLLAMDSDSSGSDKENESRKRNRTEVIDLTGGTIEMTVGDQTKSFYSSDEAHDWFRAMAGYQKAARLIAEANRRTLKKNEEKKGS
ncbi:MAG: hypothetical protein NTW22_01755 [Proteobacteria bacterium]|nr:hypothetical protein [Pseudomonadota bacterium]